MLFPLLLQLAGVAFEPAPTPDEQEVIDARLDELSRLTVPVSVNGGDPVRFLIDTGAERTVVGNVVAAGLPGPRVAATMIHMAGSTPVELVRVAELAIGAQVYRGLDAPILPRRTMGVDGVLGADALQEQRVLFDFTGGRVTFIQPGERPPPGDTIVVKARRRSGRLILTTARIDGVRVDVVIDTGAHRTIANPAVAERLERRRRSEPSVLTSITGDTIATRLLPVRRLEIGSLLFEDFVVGVTDSPAFAALDLERHPAILLGMDALGQFASVLVDFPRRTVTFTLPDGAKREERRPF